MSCKIAEQIRADAWNQARSMSRPIVVAKFIIAHTTSGTLDWSPGQKPKEKITANPVAAQPSANASCGIKTIAHSGLHFMNPKIALSFPHKYPLPADHTSILCFDTKLGPIQCPNSRTNVCRKACRKSKLVYIFPRNHHVCFFHYRQEWGKKAVTGSTTSRHAIPNAVFKNATNWSKRPIFDQGTPTGSLAPIPNWGACLPMSVPQWFP